MRFSKGHGTENDFVLLPDPDGVLDLTPARVTALCDRRRGLGADGVLRVVRWDALNDEPAPVSGVEWFMDHRNADGSTAEMCGNGIRVFARFLAHAGWLTGGEHRIGTRGGVRTVRLDGRGNDEEVAVDMGTATVGEASTARIDGQSFAGVAVDVGNPHLACLTDVAIEELDLTRPPGHDPAVFPAGVNIELVSPVDGHDAVRMRVHERGVGETRSCGTGTVAAAVATLHHAGRTTGAVAVHTRGGLLRVTVGVATTVLHGPAVLVAHGELVRSWWDALDTGGAEGGITGDRGGVDVGA